MKMFTAIFLLAMARCDIINFQDQGAVPDDSSLNTALKNGEVLNLTLASLVPGDVLLISNKTFHLMGGIIASNLSSVTLYIGGTLAFAGSHEGINHWPRDSQGHVLECLSFKNISNVTFTSDGQGTLDGQGSYWWGVLGYIKYRENRPRILTIADSEDILIEKLMFRNSPYWTFYATNVNGLEIRHSTIDVRRTSYDGHSAYNLLAFNTDGFDVNGRNVWIHDVDIWNQDDCIAVKGNSENMLFERITASGLGLTIGSIAAETVRNITFRDCYMYRTYKGIYLKFRSLNGPGLIEDITYENIVMDSPEQWAIWIGPAQQAEGDSINFCRANPCSLCWPRIPWAKCYVPELGQYVNITLRNITINNPKWSPGVLLGSHKFPMTGVVFEDVVVNNPGSYPWKDDYYKCENVEGIAIGRTWPIPPCFKDANSDKHHEEIHDYL